MPTYLISSQNNFFIEEKILEIIQAEKFSLESDHIPHIIHIVEKEGDAKSISIKQIQDCSNFINFKPVDNSKKKFLLIKEANFLTIEAQNSLLKTIEEPPEYLDIIMSTNDLTKILPTVISRALLIQNATDLDNFLQNNEQLIAEAINILHTDIAGRIDWIEANKDLFKDRLYIHKHIVTWQLTYHYTLMYSLTNKDYLNKINKLTKVNIEYLDKLNTCNSFINNYVNKIITNNLNTEIFIETILFNYLPVVK